MALNLRTHAQYGTLTFEQVDANWSDLEAAEASLQGQINLIVGDGSAADLVSLTDAGDYYTSTDVEGALQEVGAMMGDVSSALDAINGEVVP